MKKQDFSDVAGTSPSLSLSSGSQSNFPLPGDAEQSIVFSVQGDPFQNLDVAIGIKCADIPAGGGVAFECSGQPALPAPVDTGWLTITMPDYSAMMQVVMPCGFSGTLTIRYRPAQGGHLPPGAHIAPALKLLR